MSGLVIGVLVKVTAWLLFVWGVTRLLRHRPAAVRHLVWAAGVGGALLLPGLEVAPGLRILPWGARDSTAPVAAFERPAPGEPAPGPRAPESPPATERPAAPPVAVGEIPPVAEHPRANSAGPVSGWSIPWSTLLFGTWALGTIYLLLRLAHALSVVRGIARRARPVDDGPVRTALDSVLSELGIRRSVRLCVAGDVAGPMSFGLWRPVVVLPRTAETWSAPRLRAVFFHEAAHVARRDYVVQLVGRVARCVYWFHPVAWLADRRLHLEQERACDDVVLDAGVPASTYAEDLMCLAGDLQPQGAVALVSTAMARPSELLGRMQYLLDGAQARRRTPRGLRLGLVAGTFALSAALGVARPDPGPAPQDKEHPMAARLVGMLDLEAYREQAIRDLVAIGAPALPSLRRALRSDSVETARGAVAALAKMVGAHRDAALVLVSALDHQAAAVRGAAAEAIGETGPEAKAALARWKESRGEAAKLHAALVGALAAPPEKDVGERVPALRGPATSILIADFGGDRIVELDGNGRQRFVLDGVSGPWDVEALPSGNLLVTEFTANRVSEVTRDRKLVWSFADLNNPCDADRLPDGNTLIADTFGNRVIEVDRAGKIVWQFRNVRAYDVERLAGGTTLIADALLGRVIEVDRAGKVRWEVKGLEGIHDADRLPNGNTLLTLRTLNEVREVDRQGKIVWRMRELKSPSDADRLPDGRTMVAEQGAVRIFSRTGEEVWRAGATWAVEVHQVQPAAPGEQLEAAVADILERVRRGDRHAAAALRAMRDKAFSILLEQLPRVTHPRLKGVILGTLVKDATDAQAVAVTERLLELMKDPAQAPLSRWLTECMVQSRGALDLVLRTAEQDPGRRAALYTALPRRGAPWDAAASVLLGRLAQADQDGAVLLIDTLSAGTTSEAIRAELVRRAVDAGSEAVALAALHGLMRAGVFQQEIARRLQGLERQDPQLRDVQRRYLAEILFDPMTYKPPAMLVADYSANRIVEFDATGKEVSAIGEIFGVWDVERLANGNLLITEFSVSRVSEVTRERKVVWSFGDLKNPYDADRLPNGNTLIADTFGRRVIEVNPKGEIVWKYDKEVHPYDADRLPSGNTLIADTHADRVLEVDRAGKIVWQLKNLPNVHDADRLPNGNTLVTIRMLNEVRELDPTGRAVFSLKDLSSPSDADRLPDGTTLVAENGFVRVFSPGGRELYRKAVTWAVEVNAL